ncbi:proton-conducting transporter membrane subunit [Candidatus Izimaplasma bacterium]|nr:proton-conducting transporter membrane subunit [Candidatus Izimaplasma bacterium]
MSAVLLIAVPLLAAFLSILYKKAAPYLLLVVSFASVILLNYVDLGTITIGGFAAPYGISLVFDSFSQVALTVVNVLFFLVSIISIWNYKKLGSILLVALAGLNGLLLTGDLFNLFVFIEVSGIAAYLITTTNKKPLATFNYLVLGTVGSSLYLLGLIILYAMFGTLNMVDLSAQITTSGAGNMVTAFPFLLMFIGLGVEAKLLPFNSWVKGILGNSNTLSGPMIAAVYASAMAFVFGRLLTSVFVFSDQLMLIISIVIIFSIIAGEAMAYASTKAREILLFSSIAQAAIVVLVFTLGFTGFGVILAAVNGFSKLVLFLVINHATEEVGSDEVADLKGIFMENKVVGAAFTVATLSILGLPLFVGFVVKMNILKSMFMAEKLIFPAVILLASVVEGVYFVKLLVQLWYKKDAPARVSFGLPIAYLVTVIAALLIVFGLYTEPLTDLAGDLVNIAQGGLL